MSFSTSTLPIYLPPIVNENENKNSEDPLGRGETRKISHKVFFLCI